MRKYILGELIEITDERICTSKYSQDRVKGIATDKAFIGTELNMDGVPVDACKVVSPGVFSFVPDTSRSKN